MNALHRIEGTLRRHGWTLLWICVGVMIGLILKLPLIPWELGDGSATVIGSALGAVGAVAGAYLVADAMIGKEDQALRQTIADCVNQVVAPTHTLDASLKHYANLPAITLDQREKEFAKVVIASTAARRELTIALNRLNSFKDAAQRLRSRGAIGYADAILCLEKLNSKLAIYDDGDGFDGATTYVSLYAVKGALEDIHKVLEILGN